MDSCCRAESATCYPDELAGPAICYLDELVDPEVMAD
jgi:hypothetical protein